MPARWVLLAAPAAAAAVAVGSAALPAVAAQPGYDAGHRLCRFTDANINESSGIAMARVPGTPDSFWTHNDSGDTARFFLVDGATCATRATYALSLPSGPSVGGESVTALDWEDMGAGPAPDGGRDLFFGDIGDNPQVGAVKTVYEVAEPTGEVPSGSTAQTEQPIDVVAIHKISSTVFPKDSETLAVLPDRRLVIVTKPRGAAPGLAYTGQSQILVSSAPLSATGGAVTMNTVATLDITQFPGANNVPESYAVSGGDIAPDGRRFVFRTYVTAYEYAVGPTYDLGAAVAGPRTVIPLLPTRQGEAITYGLDGRSLFTTSEGSGTASDVPPGGVVDRYDPPADPVPPATVPEGRPWALLAVAAVASAAALVLLRRRRIAESR